MTEVSDFGEVVLVVSVALLLALLSSRLSTRFRIPAAAVLLIGAAVASDIAPRLGTTVSIHDVTRIGVIALIVILFDGGMDLGWRSVRTSIGPILGLGIVGTFVTGTVAPSRCPAALRPTNADLETGGQARGSKRHPEPRRSLFGSNFSWHDQFWSLWSDSLYFDALALVLADQELRRITTHGRAFVPESGRRSAGIPRSARHRRRDRDRRDAQSSPMRMLRSRPAARKASGTRIW